MNVLAGSFAVCAVFILGAGPGASAGGGKVGDDPIEVAQQQAPLAPSAQAGPGDRNVPEKAFFEEFGGLLRFDSLGRDATSYLVFATASGTVSVGRRIHRAASPLAKGSNLCHGTGGNGYAFLKLHHRTGSALWLDRARAFAMTAIAQFREARTAFGRGRYALWTGEVGLAIYLWDCLAAEPRFPTIDVF